VTTHAYSRMLDMDGLREEIAVLVAQHDAKDVVSQTQIAKRIQSAFMRRPLPQDAAESIRAAYRKMCASEPDLPVAVRSSGTAEDMPDASFAGQGDTYLWVVGEAAVLDRVKACWASLYNARAMAYRAEQQVHEEDVMMAVGVQKMVDARSSGVAMTLDPASGDRSKIVVEAAWGLGEMVVSGEITPDQFIVDKILLEPVKRKIAIKSVELVPDIAAKKTVHRDVERERQDIPSIDNDQIKTIARIAKQLERRFGQPQDIEWAIDRHGGDNFGVVLLQCRPETVWSNKASAPAPTTPKNYATGIDGIVNTLLTPVKIKKS
jgi:pyruvate, water dikinase